MLALALVVVLGAGAAVVVNSGLFAVTDVVVNGSDHIPQQTAEQLVAIPEGATLFNVSDEEVASALLKNPWVTGVDLERRFPHTIVVTPREREVLELVAEGLEPSQIEQTLFLSHNTLKTHLRHIYAKLGVHTREEAAELVGVPA